MAIETKIMRVENSESIINETNRLMGYFGWDTSNVQITNSQSSRTYSSAWDQIGGNQTQTVETTVINYATVTYQRDKNIAHRDQLCELEDEFWRVDESLKECKNQKLNDEMGWFFKLFLWPLAILKYLRAKIFHAGLDEKIMNLEARRKEILATAQKLTR